MLRWRLLLGATLIVVVAALAAWEHNRQPPGVWVTLPVLLVITVLASQEFISLARAAGHDLWDGVVYVGNVSIVLSVWCVPALGFHHSLGAWGPPAIALCAAMLLAFATEMARFRRPGESIGRLAATSLALLYVGLLTSFLAQLRMQGGGALGIPAIASLLIVVKLGDTGAYGLGRLLGGRVFRRKLAPTLSPGKSIEGAIGALLLACIGAGLAIEWLLPAMLPSPPRELAAWRWLAYGLMVGSAGIFGDLAESLLKRDAGRKDSSGWLPGFGGVLDLVDSILMAAPVAYLCWAGGLIRP